MILVTLGTQDKKFYRLLDALEKLKEKNIIKDEIIVQAGYSSDYQSKYMKIFDLLPMDEFSKLMSKCDLLITHGGVGSIIDGLKNNKIIIAVPRLKKYNEHTNDHQVQIVNNFGNMGYLLPLYDMNKLEKIINKSKTFKPKKYVSNTEKMINLIDELIMN